MTPLRRRSARLASATPKPTKTAPDLSSVAEHEEPTTHQPDSLDALVLTPAQAPATPLSSAVKPPHDEMHPSKAHPSTAAPSSALALGFANIRSVDKNVNTRPRGQDGTPSKIGGVPSSPFTFRLARDAAETQLSEGAKQMMEELREQAAKIKAELIAQREAEATSDPAAGRKIAQPKGKTGRFSAAHMAEFKKMDSIEGHASAWRAQNGRSTPVKSALKRSRSKAELDATPTSVKSNLKRSASKASLDDTPNGRSQMALKHTSSIARRIIASPQRHQLPASPARAEPPAAATETAPSVKRAKKHQEDDASAARPVSRGNTSIPVKSNTTGMGALTTSTSSLARLMSPTKSSLAHFGAQGKPTVSLVQPSSVPGLVKSASSMMDLSSPEKPADLQRRIVSPGRFERVKSILRGRKSTEEGEKTAIPQPTPTKVHTPRQMHTEKALPPLPLTTPRRMLTKKKVTFTPDILRNSSFQNSPSPKKPVPGRLAAGVAPGQVNYPVLGGVLTEKVVGDVSYPDLSKSELLAGEDFNMAATDKKPSVPGTFTFRSDHTIQFGGLSPRGFGTYAGQSSLRHVRGSMLPTAKMPGSFPVPPSPSIHPNKENQAPTPSKPIAAIPHGLPNKKRHRSSTDEGDVEREAEQRAAKKLKNEHVPEGDALLAPRLTGVTSSESPKNIQTQVLARIPLHTPNAKPGRFASRTPVRTPGSASPNKKRIVLSVSRLNMLARPKHRV